MNLCKFKLPTIAMVVLVLLMAVGVSPVFADGPPKDASAGQSSVNAKDAARALRFRLEAERQMKNDVRPPSMLASDSQFALATATWDNVVLGTNKTFYTADGGNSNSGHSGWVTGFWNANYYLDSRQDQCFVDIGPAGWGSAWAWASVGKFFQTSGGDSRVATIRMNGDFFGWLGVVGAANSAFSIDLILYDYTTQSEWSQNIAQDSTGLVGLIPYSGTFSKNLTVVLNSGHQYCAYMLLHTSAGYSVGGDVLADFGHQHGGVGHADYSSISVAF